MQVLCVCPPDVSETFTAIVIFNRDSILPTVPLGHWPTKFIVNSLVCYRT